MRAGSLPSEHCRDAGWELRVNPESAQARSVEIACLALGSTAARRSSLRSATGAEFSSRPRWPIGPRSTRHTRGAQIATFLRRCAVFFQIFQRAVETAKSSYSPDAWLLLTPSERSAAICRELQVLEAQAVKDGSSTPPPRPRRRSSRRRSL